MLAVNIAIWYPVARGSLGVGLSDSVAIRNCNYLVLRIAILFVVVGWDKLGRIADNCDVPVSILIDRNNDIVFGEKVYLGGPRLDAIIINPLAILGGFQLIIKEGILKIDSLRQIFVFVFQVLLQKPKVEDDDIVIQELAFVKALDVILIDGRSVLSCVGINKRVPPPLFPARIE